MKRTAKNYLDLFWTWFIIGLTTFGGGYAMIAIIQNKIVEKRKWISNDELTKIIAIAESTPGPIAINSATYIGYKLLGVFGSFLATLGVILPSFVIIYVISLFFNNLLQYQIVQYAFKGIKASVSALILLAGIKMLKSTKKDLLTWIIFGITLALTIIINVFDWNVSSVFLILAGALIGLVTVFATKNKGEPPQNDTAENSSQLLNQKNCDKEGKQC